MSKMKIVCKLVILGYIVIHSSRVSSVALQHFFRFFFSTFLWRKFSIFVGGDIHVCRVADPSVLVEFESDCSDPGPYLLFIHPDPISTFFQICFLLGRNRIQFFSKCVSKTV